MWLNVDPLAETTPSWSPYAYGFDNPIRFIDPTGMQGEDWVKQGNRIFYDPSVQGQDAVSKKYEGGQSITGYSVTQNDVRTHYALGDDGSITTTVGSLDFLSTTKSVYSSGDISTGAATIEGQQCTTCPTMGPIPESRGKTDIQMLVAENPLVQDAVMGALTAGAGSWLSRSARGAAAVESVAYTKSSLSMGREMHSGYKLAEHAPELGRFKEFTGIKGIRPDYVDFGTKTIYELKPFNPRGMQSGAKQLQKYQSAFEKTYGGKWNTVLDHY